jgi:hypothetical protein
VVRLRSEGPGYPRAVRSVVLAGCVIAGVALTSCSSGHGGQATPPSAASSTAGSTAPTRATTTTASFSTTAPVGVRNLVVTDQLRAELVAAGAALDNLPASDYVGLRPGETYYAYDASTSTYWAGAGLDPSPSSTPAEVAAQDDGAYQLFERQDGGGWKAYAVGLAGTPEGSSCPIAVPPAVLQVWNWPAGSCRPLTIS